jgi:hypothetical protein
MPGTLHSFLRKRGEQPLTKSAIEGKNHHRRGYGGEQHGPAGEMLTLRRRRDARRIVTAMATDDPIHKRTP